MNDGTGRYIFEFTSGAHSLFRPQLWDHGFMIYGVDVGALEITKRENPKARANFYKLFANASQDGHLSQFKRVAIGDQNPKS